MVHYKIVNFEGSSTDETARLLLTHEGIDFEDVRIPRAEWPGDHKAGTNASALLTVSWDPGAAPTRTVTAPIGTTNARNLCPCKHVKI